MVEEQLIDCLRGKAKGKSLMFPEQLAEEIGIPAKQQSKLRTEGRFLIRFKNVCRLVYYPIYDVASFLLNGKKTIATASQEVEIPMPLPTKKKPAKSPSPVQDLSHILVLGAFEKYLEDRATSMISSAHNLDDYAKKKEMMESFHKESSKN